MRNDHNKHWGAIGLYALIFTSTITAASLALSTPGGREWLLHETGCGIAAGIAFTMIRIANRLTQPPPNDRPFEWMPPRRTLRCFKIDLLAGFLGGWAVGVAVAVWHWFTG